MGPYTVSVVLTPLRTNITDHEHPIRRTTGIPDLKTAVEECRRLFKWVVTEYARHPRPASNGPTEIGMTIANADGVLCDLHHDTVSHAINGARDGDAHYLDTSTDIPDPLSSVLGDAIEKLFGRGPSSTEVHFLSDADCPLMVTWEGLIHAAGHLLSQAYVMTDRIPDDALEGIEARTLLAREMREHARLIRSYDQQAKWEAEANSLRNAKEPEVTNDVA